MIYKKIMAWLIITKIITAQKISDLRWLSWRKYILLPWHRLFIKKDEFHASLDLDSKSIQKMDNHELRKYYQGLAQRRSVAHNRTIDT